MEYTPIAQIYGGLSLLVILATYKIVVHQRMPLNSLLLTVLIVLGGLFIFVIGTLSGGMLIGLLTVIAFCLPIITANYGKLP